MRPVVHRRRRRVAGSGQAEPYLMPAAEEARRRGHGYVGTEHVLFVLSRDPDGEAMRLLGRLGVDAPRLRGELACRLEPAHERATPLDPDALAALGIDFEAVRERLERSFGPGALERTRTGCTSICPRLKRALGFALDLAGAQPLGDEHVVLGMLGVPDSVAARVLANLGVTLERARAAARSGMLPA